MTQFIAFFILLFSIPTGVFNGAHEAVLMVDPATLVTTPIQIIEMKSAPTPSTTPVQESKVIAGTTPETKSIPAPTKVECTQMYMGMYNGIMQYFPNCQVVTEPEPTPIVAEPEVIQSNETAVALVVKAEPSIVNIHGIAYGGNCSDIKFTTNLETTFNGQTGTIFYYKPQATSTTEHLFFASEHQTTTYDLQVAGSFMDERKVHPFDDTRWIEESTGTYIDPVTGKCL